MRRYDEVESMKKMSELEPEQQRMAKMLIWVLVILGVVALFLVGRFFC